MDGPMDPMAIHVQHPPTLLDENPEMVWAGVFEVHTSHCLTVGWCDTCTAE
jgi:hypothetical protein